MRRSDPIDDKMDLDDDIASDVIRKFLSNKLQEIKLHNEKLENVLAKRENILRDESKRLQVACTSEIKIQDVWKRIWNSKYALGICVTGSNHELDSEQTRIILKWNCSFPLQYETYFPRIPTTNENIRIIIVTLDVPDFSMQLSYELYGAIVSRLGSTSTSLPPIELNATDLSEFHLKHPLNKLTEGDVTSLMTYLLCNQKRHFFISLDESAAQRLHDSVLEIDCGFTKIISFQNIYYFAHNISPAFDGSLLQAVVQDTASNFRITLYCRDEESATACILHLQRHINGMLIFPDHLKNFSPSRNPTEFKSRLVKRINEESNLVDQYCELRNSSSDRDLKEYRLKMIVLEKNTDDALRDAVLANDCIQKDIVDNTFDF